MNTRQSLVVSLATIVLAGCAQPLTATKPLGSSAAPVGKTPALTSPLKPTGAPLVAPALGAPLAGVAAPPAPVTAPALLDGQTTTTLIAAEADLEAYDLFADRSTPAVRLYAALALASTPSPTPLPAASASPAASPSASALPSARPSAGASPLPERPHAKPAFKAGLKEDQRIALSNRRKLAKSAAIADKAQSEASARIARSDSEAAWKDNGDGTMTKTLVFDLVRSIDGKPATRRVTLVRTVLRKTFEPVSVTSHLTETRADGSTHVLDREKSLQADGSFHVVTHAEVTTKQGARQVIDTQKTIGADGQVTGTGTLVAIDANGKTLAVQPLRQSGSAEAPKLEAAKG